METDNNNQDNSIQTDNLIGKGIGRHKYEYLKSFPKEKLSETQIKQIEIYESRFAFNPDAEKRTKEYFESLRNKKEIKEITFTSRQLYDVFLFSYKQITNRDFVVNRETIKNIEPLIYYFSKDKRFFNCDNLTKLSEPSFNKGLLVVGDYGNGKTSAFRAIENIFKYIPSHIFTGYTANEVVTDFEKCKDDVLREEFEFSSLS